MSKTKRTTLQEQERLSHKHRKIWNKLDKLTPAIEDAHDRTVKAVRKFVKRVDRTNANSLCKELDKEFADVGISFLELALMLEHFPECWLHDGHHEADLDDLRSHAIDITIRNVHAKLQEIEKWEKKREKKAAKEEAA